MDDGCTSAACRTMALIRSPRSLAGAWTLSVRYRPLPDCHTNTHLTKITGKGRARSVATLVHCRVGVSRSATICIAEIMNEYGLSFPRA